TVTNPAAACVCANDSTARLTTTGANGIPAIYCEPVSLDLDGTSDSVELAPACEGFDCGAHGACVPMNGNPTCQCEAGYAAAPSSVYDQTTGLSTNTITCVPSSIRTPMLPVLPPVGQTTLPRGSGGEGAGGASSGAAGGQTGGVSSTPMPAGGGTTNAAFDSGPSSGGCSVARTPGTNLTTGLLLAIGAAVARRRRRQQTGPQFS
ncbi:MAG TPA: MYXO-CTERM sorting domain-containing protein, partial [Polyangiaceae bacterium]|nr:MYXO-CTERM sorting domain-containing protein [Polyangiaceae bacterium]